MGHTTDDGCHSVSHCIEIEVKKVFHGTLGFLRISKVFGISKKS